MCGIAGLLRLPTEVSSQGLRATVGSMAGLLQHRGPDADGLWIDEEVGVAVGHRRLAVLDLTASGAQPMVSACGRYVIAFNGEIYNHLLLRQKLQVAGLEPSWRGHSDTEVMLAAIAAWGVAGALAEFVGMFAFALWDRQQRRLTLARDRLGEKPLYYGRVGGAIVFASEPRAFRVVPGWSGRVCREALALFLRFAYVPAPYCIYDGIWKLPPGAYLELTSSDLSKTELPAPSAYWSIRDAALKGMRAPVAGSETELVGELDRLLRQAVGGQMVADVPLGAFLSGGVDSSTVVALMQAQSAIPVRTFSIGFAEEGYNEAEHARAVAAHLGTDHCELVLTGSDALAAVPELPGIFDEPFADSSQLPTFLVAKLARSRVTVSISGDGGDELFGGYNRYLEVERIWRRLSSLPRWVRRPLAGGLRSLRQSDLDRGFRWAARRGVVPARLIGLSEPGQKLHKIARVLGSRTTVDAYAALCGHWLDGVPTAGGADASLLASVRAPISRELGVADGMMLSDAEAYLPDDILVKVDRAAMAVSLETRVPMLDHRVVEFAWRIPASMKIRNGVGKWILRQVLYRYVPASLMERPKAGFAVPVGAWLRGPLRDWAESLLSPERLSVDGLLDPEPICRAWREHLAGNGDWQHGLWNVLMFQAWRERWV